MNYHKGVIISLVLICSTILSGCNGNSKGFSSPAATTNTPLPETSTPIPPTLTPSQTSTITITYDPLPYGWNLDKIILGLSDSKLYVLHELYGRIFIDRMKDRTNFPNFIQSSNRIIRTNTKTYLYDVCLYFNQSSRIQRLINQPDYQVPITTFQEFQDYFLGGPFCYAVIETIE